MIDRPHASTRAVAQGVDPLRAVDDLAVHDANGSVCFLQHHVTAQEGLYSGHDIAGRWGTGAGLAAAFNKAAGVEFFLAWFSRLVRYVEK